MTTKKTPAAATSIEAFETAWRAAVANAATAGAALQGLNASPNGSREERIRYLAAKATELEAIDAETAAREAYAHALEAREPTDPDEIAEVADCRPATVRADLVSLLAKEQQAKAEHEAARARTAARKAKAYAANEALANRRRGQGLPPPPALPRAATTSSGAVDDSAATFIEALDRGAVAAPGVNAGPIAQMRSEENRLRVLEERERIGREEELAKRLEIRKQHAQEYADRCAATAARNRAVDVEVAQERAEEARLADAHRARSAP